MASPVLQLKDVYDIAQSVGESFQLLIQRFGNASFAELVNTVVNALEHLETFVQENQKLQARLCKLLLGNDKLLKDNEKLKAESQENLATLASLEVASREKVQLALQLEGTREANRELIKQMEDIAAQTHRENGKKGFDQDSATEFISDEPRRKSSEGLEDAMEVPRLRRRLAQTENELKRTRVKLLSAQSTLKCIVSENNVLKAQVQESKAEIGLKTLQLSTGSYCPQGQESPKFYKKDLLVVLRERNGLKEQVDALRDELNMARLQMRYHYQPEGETETRENGETFKLRANTKVRDIVTSITADSFQEKKGKCSRKSVT